MGYPFAELSLAATYFPMVLHIVSTFSFYAGSCLFVISFVRDITNDLKLLNVGGASSRSQKKRLERFGKIIQLHSDVKELSGKI